VRGNLPYTWRTAVPLVKEISDATVLMLGGPDPGISPPVEVPAPRARGL